MICRYEIEKYSFFIYGKNDFAEASKTLAGYIKSNFIGPSKCYVGNSRTMLQKFWQIQKLQKLEDYSSHPRCSTNYYT